MSAQPQGFSGEQLVQFSFQSRIQAILYATIHRIIRRPDLVEEVIQDVRLSCLTQTDRELINPKAWLIALARNRALDLARHTYVAREELVATIDEEDEACEDVGASNIDPARLIETDERLRLMLQAMYGLTERQREVVTLRKVYGYSQKEISQRMGISENTVEQHMVRALRSLSQTLNGRLTLDE